MRCGRRCGSVSPWTPTIRTAIYETVTVLVLRDAVIKAVVLAGCTSVQGGVLTVI